MATLGSCPFLYLFYHNLYNQFILMELYFTTNAEFNGESPEVYRK